MDKTPLGGMPKPDWDNVTIYTAVMRDGTWKKTELDTFTGTDERGVRAAVECIERLMLERIMFTLEYN